MTAPALSLLIAVAQAELRWETPIRLHSEHAPKLLDADGTTTHYPDEGGIGLPFTADFHRLLALRERFAADYLMRESLLEVADWCHAQHPTHVRPGERLPVCGWLAESAVIGDIGWADLCRMSGLTEARMRSTLSTALAHAADWRSGQRDKAGIEWHNPFADETLPERMRREHDLPAQERAWTAMRAKYPTLEPWERELRRRRTEHARYDCANCALVAA